MEALLPPVLSSPLALELVRFMEGSQTHLQALLHVLERTIDSCIKQSPTFFCEMFESRTREPVRDVFDFGANRQHSLGSRGLETERTYRERVDKEGAGNHDPVCVPHRALYRLQELVFL